MSLASALTARQIRTSRLLTNVHTVGDPEGIPVVLVHGNVSSNRFFDVRNALVHPPLRK